MLTDDTGSSQVSKGESVQTVARKLLESLDLVEGVDVEDRSQEEGDADAHDWQTDHDVKVCIDSVTEDQEWVLQQLSLVLG